MKKTNSGFAVKTHFQDKDGVLREIYDRLLNKVEQFALKANSSQARAI